MVSVIPMANKREMTMKLANGLMMVMTTPSVAPAMSSVRGSSRRVPGNVLLAIQSPAMPAIMDAIRV